MSDNDLDVVGYWTEIKLKILSEYASAYSTILQAQSAIKHFSYIDGFAGAGTHISEATHQEIDGSPTIALKHNFSHYHFIDLNGARIAKLKELAAGRHDISVYKGDCNDILLKEVFPKCLWTDFRRALCLLDPYGLNPKWSVIKEAGKMRSIEIFLNFMIMDANMNILWNNPQRVPIEQAQRMTDFWGDESWREAAYVNQAGLFGDIPEKTTNESVINAYRERLQKVAGFQYVPEPIPMKNSKGATVYYLFFASNNQTGDKIARAIFDNYRERKI